MEGIEKMIRNATKDLKLSNLGTKSSSISDSTDYSNGGVGVGVALSSSDQSRILVPRAARNMVSLWTCSKLCAIFFAVGVIAGYTLKRRVRRWASRLLRRLKDD